MNVVHKKSFSPLANNLNFHQSRLIQQEAFTTYSMYNKMVVSITQMPTKVKQSEVKISYQP